MFRQLTISFRLLLLLLAAMGACTPTARETEQLNGTATKSQDDGYPGPQPTEIPFTLTPEPTLGEVTPFEFDTPAPTPAPLFTRQPTPTREPSTTPFPVPLIALPNSPAGIIRYATHSDPHYQGTNSYFAITINAEGGMVEEATTLSLPPELEADIFQIHPSPNGSYQVWMVSSEPGGIPYIFNEATGEATPLYTEAYGGGRFYEWHPDGQHFLFWLDFIGLWLVNAETLEITTLTLPYGIVQGAAFSPDGQTIAYIDANPPDSLGSLWFVSMAGSDAVPLVDAGSQAFIHPGAWSPNGTQLIYRGDCPGANQQNHISTPLCLFDVQTKESQFLELPFTVAYNAPRWSPDGRYILTTGLTEGKTLCSLPEREEEPVACLFTAQSVYVFDTETGTAVALVEGISPVWSPDGSMIAFLSNSSELPEVWTIRIDGTELQQLTSDGQFKSPFSNLNWIWETSNE